MKEETLLLIIYTIAVPAITWVVNRRKRAADITSKEIDNANKIMDRVRKLSDEMENRLRLEIEELRNENCHLETQIKLVSRENETLKKQMGGLQRENKKLQEQLKIFNANNLITPTNDNGRTTGRLSGRRGKTNPAG